MNINLPCSNEMPYPQQYWNKIERQLLQLHYNPTLEILENSIRYFLDFALKPGESKDEFSIETLKEVLGYEKNKIFLPSVLPYICSMALEMPKLFPAKALQILQSSSCDTVEYTRTQCTCLVAHMFFSTILPSKQLVNFNGQLTGNNSKADPITFHHWYSCNTKPTRLYIQCLLNYFSCVHTNREDNRVVKFKRIILQETDFPTWELSGTKLLLCVPHLEGSIGDIEGHVEVDFANKNVGFGTTGTQEELLLGSSPESCLVGLFTETLLPREALLIQGVQKNGCFTGYGSNVEYNSLPNKHRDWTLRKILAIDANEYIGDEKVQLKDCHLKRELGKTFCGFSMLPDNEVVDSGHWGCGVFGGNKGIKALLQLLAASEAGIKELHFYSFRDADFHGKFCECLKWFQAKELTVGDIWKYIKVYEKKLRKEWMDGISEGNNTGVLEFILKELTQECNLLN